MYPHLCTVILLSYFYGLYLSKPRVRIQVTSFIREQSRENMQIIVISLKEEFFSKSDALLGVYSDVTNFLYYVANWRRLVNFSYVMTMQSLLYSLLDSLMNACLAAFWPWTCNLTLWLKRTMKHRPTRRRQDLCSLESPVQSLCMCGSLAISLVSVFSSRD